MTTTTKTRRWKLAVQRKDPNEIMLNLWTQIFYCCLSSIEGSEKHLISAPIEEALFCMNCLLIHVFEDTLQYFMCCSLTKMPSDKKTLHLVWSCVRLAVSVRCVTGSQSAEKHRKRSSKLWAKSVLRIITFATMAEFCSICSVRLPFLCRSWVPGDHLCFRQTRSLSLRLCVCDFGGNKSWCCSRQPGGARIHPVVSE